MAVGVDVVAREVQQAILFCEIVRVEFFVDAIVLGFLFQPDRIEGFGTRNPLPTDGEPKASEVTRTEIREPSLNRGDRQGEEERQRLERVVVSTLVARRGFGDFGRPSRLHSSSPLGPERLSGSLLCRTPAGVMTKPTPIQVMGCQIQFMGCQIPSREFGAGRECEFKWV